MNFSFNGLTNDAVSYQESATSHGDFDDALFAELSNSYLNLNGEEGHSDFVNPRSTHDDLSAGLCQTSNSLGLELGPADLQTSEDSFFPGVDIWHGLEPVHIVEDHRESDFNMGDMLTALNSPLGSGFESDIGTSSPESAVAEAFSPTSSSSSDDMGSPSPPNDDDDDDDDDEYLPDLRLTTRARPRVSASASTRRRTRGGTSANPRQTVKPRPAASLHDHNSATDFYTIEEDDPSKPYITVRDSRNRRLYKCRKPNCKVKFTKAHGDMQHHLKSLAHQPPSCFCPVPKCGKRYTRPDAVVRHMGKKHRRA